MNDVFDFKKLAVLTLLLAIFPFLNFDDDYQGAIHLSVGFIYTLILLYSLRSRPSFALSYLSVLVLGLANIFIHFSAFPLIFLPEDIGRLLMLPWVSAFGGFLTAFILSKLWKLHLNINNYLLIAGLVFCAGIFSQLIIYLLLDTESFRGLWIAVNASPWVCAFSFGLYRIYRNKSIEDVFKTS